MICILCETGSKSKCGGNKSNYEVFGFIKFRQIISGSVEKKGVAEMGEWDSIQYIRVRFARMNLH